jgi:hypothetical protein
MLSRTCSFLTSKYYKHTHKLTLSLTECSSCDIKSHLISRLVTKRTKSVWLVAWMWETKVSVTLQTVL